MKKAKKYKQYSTISILMPVKNTANYLEGCLDSILAQSWSNWELIAIDDHSTDNSAAILQAYSQKDNRISTFSNEGKGIIQALRTAFKNSKGKYITRMDSDDVMAKNKLEVLLKNIQNYGEKGIAIGQVQYFSDAPLGNGYQKYEYWLNQLTKRGINYQEIYKECVIPSPCWLVHRTDLEACGAFEPNRYPEDYDLCFRFYQYGLEIIPCEEVLHYWRDYPNRTSRTDKNYADNRFLQLKLDYFLQLDYRAEKSLVLWGAGKKGKKLAQQLIDKTIPFHWVCNNPKKVGKAIYSQVLKDSTFLKDLMNAQYIVAVANPEEQRAIKEQLVGEEYFFFC